MEELKRCSGCKIPKPFNEFHKRKKSKDGHDHYCKECGNARHRKKYANDFKYRERIKLKNHNYNNNLRELKLIELSELNNKCAICGKSVNELGRALCIDHSHSTSKIRGLLCTKCNLGIGSFMDNIILLENAISYLKNNG